ncbi:protein translocase subunit SecF [Nocardioides guangzhouensis]|uniref:Protein-export membrane protein SecF n=1 Tax=Nocardioides guangzhouensis TaxID=2497878 RepID=A0A4Q4Z441_9ACTN|nr:protein translocase subunit SecF [Nocardioides guangzhouensis]RYP81644.1 protein translocase subunit SecF [Nocardioides guangzhouensis]
MSKLSRLGNALYEGDVSIDFVSKKRRRLWYSVSLLIVLVAVLGLWFKGLNLGIEFEGGSEYRVSLPSDQVNQDTADRLREVVGGLGIKDAEQPVVTTSGSEAVLVQTESLSTAESRQVSDAILQETGASQGDLSQSNIGASWGRDILDRALLGLSVFLALVILFIWAYFREWKMSVAAIVALAHDVLITVGIYALSGFEVSPATVTGILTILGFSLYDTVVVFDKVRENTKNLQARRTTYAKAANLAVNQTLVRSINTSIVALLPVAAILYVSVVQLGSGSLQDLALALFVGMAAGLYSSIFIATPLVVQLKSNEREVVQAEKRAAARKAKADRYADVPVFTEDMPIADEPGAGGDRQPARTGGGTGTGTTRTSPTRRPEGSGSGRVVPEAHRPVSQSGSSKRQQPQRQSRSKRGKK